MGKLRRIALVAVLAIVSSALLPYAHGATGHTGDCGVCFELAHSGAQVADPAPALALPAAQLCVAVDAAAVVPATGRRDFDPRGARAPPEAPVSA